ncbi:MAG: pyridoxal phosphate-dependent aminotransferase [Microvirgula sp.]
MDRRTLLKSSGLLVGLAALGSRAVAQTPATAAPAANDSPAVFIPSADTPLRLNFNENSLGMSPRAKQALAAVLPGQSCRYPDDAREALVATIARLNGLSDKQVILGNGSSELIHTAVLNAALMPNAQLVVADPTFNNAEVHAKAMGLKTVKVGLTRDHVLDIAGMRAAADAHPGPSTIYLCNPNNPTATITPAAVIDKWIASAPDRVTFIVDEAYHEYVTDPRYQSAIKWVKQGKKNVIVLRTCSKVFGLAGLRVGYAFAHPDTIGQYDAHISIDNINLAGAATARASLEDAAWIRHSLASTAQGRAIAVEAFRRLHLDYMPSQANFIMHRIKGSTTAYQAEMKKRHVLVGRLFDHTDGWNRLTIGTPEEMRAFVKVLDGMRRDGLV